MIQTPREKRGVSFWAKTCRQPGYNSSVKEKTMQKELFDCMITCGERDPDRYGHYKKDTNEKLTTF